MYKLQPLGLSTYGNVDFHSYEAIKRQMPIVIDDEDDNPTGYRRI